jgi:hypothetical protein
MSQPLFIVVRVFRQSFRFDDTDVQAVDESVALKDNFPETDGSTQAASILFYVSSK